MHFMNEKLFILLVRILMFIFGVTTILFVLFPIQIIDSLNTIGTAIGDFEKLDLREKGIWYVLSISYMVVITILCFLIQGRPKNAKALVVALVSGKLSSSIFSFYLFLYEKRAFGFIVTSIIDGAIAALLIGSFIMMTKSSLRR